MRIETESQARHIAGRLMACNTVVVSESGDVHANCDVDAICSEHEAAGKKYFILKGERIKSEPPKKEAKNNKTDK